MAVDPDLIVLTNAMCFTAVQIGYGVVLEGP